MLRTRKNELKEAMRDNMRRLRSIEARLSGIPLPDVVLKAVPEFLAVGRRAKMESARDAWIWILETAAAVRRWAPKQVGSSMILLKPDDGFETDNFSIEAYMPVVESSRRRPADDGIELFTFPAIDSTATVVQGGGPDLLHRGCAAIGEWVELHGYRLAGPAREVILSMPEGGDYDNLVIETQFPVTCE